MEEAFDQFTKYTPLLDVYLAEPMSFNNVLKLATHDLKGALRSKTSAGLGFNLDRKEIARSHVEDMFNMYNYDVYDYDIYWKVFLKDELRETAKATRSIAVGQLHMWVQGMKYLGKFYQYFSDLHPSWTGYGMDDKANTWNKKFGHWDYSKVTVGFDIKKQDSRMSPGYVSFFESFLKRIIPLSHWGAIEWIFDQCFYSKKIVDTRGHILQISLGEMSGFFLTIVMNTFHNLFIHIMHILVCKHLGLADPGRLFVILGDDTALQSDHPILFQEIALVIGHETTTEQGPFVGGWTFLSQKLNVIDGMVVPYYANMDKMFASLVYTTGGEDEYFQKLCSYYRQLLFAPRG